MTERVHEIERRPHRVYGNESAQRSHRDAVSHTTLTSACGVSGRYARGGDWKGKDRNGSSYCVSTTVEPDKDATEIRWQMGWMRLIAWTGMTMGWSTPCRDTACTSSSHRCTDFRCSGKAGAGRLGTCRRTGSAGR